MNPQEPNKSLTKMDNGGSVDTFCSAALAAFVLVSALFGTALLVTLHHVGAVQVVPIDPPPGVVVRSASNPLGVLLPMSLGMLMLLAWMLIMALFRGPSFLGLVALCMGVRRESIGGSTPQPKGANQNTPAQVLAERIASAERKRGTPLGRRLLIALLLMVCTAIFSGVIGYWTWTIPRTPLMRFGIMALLLWFVIAMLAHKTLDILVALLARIGWLQPPESYQTRRPFLARSALGFVISFMLALCYWFPWHWLFLTSWLDSPASQAAFPLV